MAKILVVDDDSAYRLVLRTTLETAGHEVVALDDPTRAVEAATAANFDCIILDVVMPEQSGMEILRQLRSEPRTAETPVILVSALDAGQDRVAGLREGADDYLAKPFEPEELRLRVRRLLRATARPSRSRPAAPLAPAAGGSIGRYLLEREVGRGAMGTIFRAWDPRLERHVAIKTLRPDRFPDRDAFVTGFLREATSAARFLHPNAVAVHDVSEADGVPFLVMELVDGVALADLLTSGRMLSVARAVGFARAVAQALSAAHAHGIVHCDVKPGNVLLGWSGAIKLADFGLARAVRGDDPEQGLIFGTPGYLPPELLKGSRYDALGDLFALGVTVYSALTGRRPFGGVTLKEMILSTAARPALPIGELQPELPLELAQLVDQLVDREPGRRPASAAEVAQRLDDFAESGAYSWSPPTADEATEPAAERSPLDVRSHHSMLLAADLSSGLWEPVEITSHPGQARASDLGS